MSLDIESEVVLRKKSAAEVEIVDARGRDKLVVKIPGVYGLRRENSPLTIALVGAVPNGSYFTYAKEPAVPRGQSPRASSGFDTVISPNSGLVDKHRYLGAVLTDADASIIGMSQDGNEFTLNSRVNVDLGAVYKSSDTVTLPIPTTASKAVVSVSIRTSEDQRATARIFVMGESKAFESVEAPIGETSGEKEFKIPVAGGQLQYKIERSRSSTPSLVIQVLGWVDGALV